MSKSKKPKQWFKENTFNEEEFSDIAELVRLKEKQGLTISCGIPTLNEEENVGEVIETIKDELMNKYDLLDEIIVLDSGSCDNTVDIAREKGVKVYQPEDFLKGKLEWSRDKEEGILKGKGENLWQSLYFLEGDIICWIDADIQNIHPRFVYGPVGALLKNKKLGYVKGFYKRPLNQGGKKVPTGGGRVTEINTRPNFNLWFPELSHIIQPLSGEYAGRREILEKIPFSVGYGVETKHLVDIWHKFGLGTIGQVNLKKRIHDNKSSVALGKMSFGILGIFYKTLQEMGYVEINKELGQEYSIPVYKGGKYSFEEIKIGDEIRPPIVEIEKYKKKFNLQSKKSIS